VTLSPPARLAAAPAPNRAATPSAAPVPTAGGPFDRLLAELGAAEDGRGAWLTAPLAGQIPVPTGCSEAPSLPVAPLPAPPVALAAPVRLDALAPGEARPWPEPSAEDPADPSAGNALAEEAVSDVALDESALRFRERGAGADLAALIEEQTVESVDLAPGTEAPRVSHARDLPPPPPLEVRAPVELPELPARADGLDRVRVDLDEHLAVEVSASEGEVDVTLLGRDAVRRAMATVETDLRDALRRGGYALGQFERQPEERRGRRQPEPEPAAPPRRRQRAFTL
jgi:hypothetical protein